MQAREEIQKIVRESVKQIIGKDVEVKLEHPAEESHGDYSSNIAMAIFSKSKIKKTAALRGQNAKFASPQELAEKIAERLRDMGELGEYVENIDAVKPGFINFWLSKKILVEELERLLKDLGDLASQGSTLQGQKVMVEFAHPNTHKLFHIGHLRNITLGEAVCRLLAAQGVKVIRANYQGDVGLHIAKALWGIKKLGFKNPETLDEKIKFLSKAYVAGNSAYEKSSSAYEKSSSAYKDGSAKDEIEDINKKLYAKDRELYQIWKETRAWSLAYFDRIYKRVSSHFDRLYFESEVAEKGKKEVLANIGKVFVKDEGAIIFQGEKYGLHNRVFINSLGLPTYEGKDVGLAKLEFSEFSPDKIIHVVGPEQSAYFQVLFKVLEELNPKYKGREEHLVYGWVRLKSDKMSSRRGEIVEGEWLLDEAKTRLQEKYPEMNDETAEMVGVGAVKYSLLRLAPQSEIAFDIDESVRLDGDSGPYLQYTFARTQSLLEKSGDQVPGAGSQVSGDRSTGKLETGNWKLEPEELNVLRWLYRFPEVVESAATNFAPNTVCSYLFELAQRYNAFYNKHRILANSDELIANRGDTKDAKRYKLNATSSFRLALTQATANILKSGLSLLGIEAPARM